MEDRKDTGAITSTSGEDLAKDVARLYSWAHVEGGDYRNFSRQRRPQVKSAAESGVSKTEAFEAVPATPEPTVVALPVIPAKERIEVPPAASPQIVSGAEPFKIQHIPPTAVAIYSLAGGVGRTTLSANLGRVLCSLGERILLVDASGNGLLPFYFGSSDLRAGLRTFVAPGGSYPPLQVLGADEVTTAWMDSTVNPAMMASQRVIFDLGAASLSLLPKIFELCSVILIPLLSDLNSILTVSRIESSLASMRSKGIDIPAAYYIFNRFDEHSLMDQQARELIVRQCGDRLLPITICQSVDVAAAIASRMTVADHAPESAVSHDFLELALWLRRIAPVKQAARIMGRWSER